MDERRWMLEGLDPALRRRATQEAARRGLSLADYVTDTVLQKLLAEQFCGQGAVNLGESTAVGAQVQTAGPAADGIVALRETMDQRLSAADAAMREALGHVEERCAEGRDEAHSRLSELEHDLAYVRRTLGAEIERVEACTLAALAKQSQDRKAGDAATAEQSMERLRKLETALADLEDRQADALEALRESIARLVSENDRRLVAIEGAAEPRDFAARLAEFRLQIHARILEVEQRSVRALEQLSQTVSVIEGRVASSESAVDAARSA